MKDLTIVGKFEWEDEFTVLAQHHGIFRRGDLNLVCFKDGEGRESFIDLKTREPFKMDAINTFAYSPWLERPKYSCNWIYNWFLLKSLNGRDPYKHPEVPRKALENLYAKTKRLYEIKLNGTNFTKKREFKRLVELYFPKAEVEKDWDLNPNVCTYEDCVDEIYDGGIWNEEDRLRIFLSYKYDSFLVAECH